MPRILPLAALALAVAVPATPDPSDLADLAKEVEAVELAFAGTMAARDFAAFQSFLSDEAVFLEGAVAQRGKAAVAAAWSPYFEGPAAPFSWRPETVEVLESGTLALSSGPVLDAAGERVSTFTSIWRLEAPGAWRIVFDRGNKYCG